MPVGRDHYRVFRWLVAFPASAAPGGCHRATRRTARRRLGSAQRRRGDPPVAVNSVDLRLAAALLAIACRGKRRVAGHSGNGADDIVAPGPAINAGASPPSRGAVQMRRPAAVVPRPVAQDERGAAAIGMDIFIVGYARLTQVRRCRRRRAGSRWMLSGVCAASPVSTASVADVARVVRHSLLLSETRLRRIWGNQVSRWARSRSKAMRRPRSSRLGSTTSMQGVTPAMTSARPP